MSQQFPELDQVRITVGADVRERHQAVIADALRSARSPRVRRLRVFAIGLAVILLLPVMALASDRAVPGDFLYPIKRAVEPVVAWFDIDVVEQHRVDEVETLFHREFEVDVIRNHIDIARDAIPPGDSRLSQRIDQVEVDLERIHGHTREPSPTDQTEEQRPATKEEPPQDQRETTDTTHADVVTDEESPETTGDRPEGDRGARP